MVFEQSWWGIVTNASKMRCEKFGWKRNLSWLGFGLAKLGVLAFCALVTKLVKTELKVLEQSCGQLSEMYAKRGVKRLVSKRIDLGWVLA